MPRALTWIISSDLNSRVTLRSKVKKRYVSETILGFGGSPKMLAGVHRRDRLSTASPLPLQAFEELISGHGAAS